MSEVVKIECPHCSQRIALPDGFNQPSATCPVCKGGIVLEFDESLPASDGLIAPPEAAADAAPDNLDADIAGGAEAWEEEPEEQETISKPSITVAPPTGEVGEHDDAWGDNDSERGPRGETANFFLSLFSFKGRIRRTTYWVVTLIHTVAMALLIGITSAVSAMSVLSGGVEGEPNMLFIALSGIIFLLGCIPLLWISFATIAKRFHDRERSGWWSLIMITGVGFIWILVECGFLEGTHGPNRFGFDPKA